MAESKRTNEALEEDGREALFRLITEEIKDLNDDDQLQGWTPWILSATLISMAWIVVQDLWNQHAQVASIHAIFLIVTLSLLFILTLRGTVKNQDVKGPFEFLHTSIPAFALLTVVMWMITIAIACLRFNGAHYLLLATGGFFGLLAITGLVFVVAIGTRLPFPVATRSQVTTGLSQYFYA